MLHDQFGRQFSYLRLSITDVCNFRCNYCLPDGYQCESDRNFLRLDEIGRIATAFGQSGTRKIRITGGEPSLRRDLPAIIARCKQAAGIEKVAMTSNGFRLQEQVSDWHAAGLDALNISVDSLDPALFKLITGHDKLRAILAGIDKALGLGITQLKVNTVLMKALNAHQLQSYLDWVKDTPLSLRFIELMQTGDNQSFFDQHHVAGESIKQTLLQSGWTQRLPGRDAGPAQEFTHPEYAGSIGLIMPYAKDFCASCNRLRISAKGKLHLCLFGEQGYDLRQLLQSDQQQTELCHYLQTQLAEKKASHFLHQGNSGSTRHLAMLGG